MKKTFNINLAGFPFIIDDDAFNLLSDYLETIRTAFAKQDDAYEIANDIESRIAEILQEEDPEGSRIVTASQITGVISRIGQPEEILDIQDDIAVNNDHEESINEDTIIEENVTPPPYNPFNSNTNPLKKKLFRDPQNSMLGGVCSGLAAYMNIDPTIVRLLTVLLFFLSATTVAIVYIILWIVVPEARTSLQRMQMLGQDPTVENIGKTVTENYREEKADISDNHESAKSGFWQFIYTCCTLFLKTLVILAIIVGALILLALFPILIICIIAFTMLGTSWVGNSIIGDYIGISSPGGGVLIFFMIMAAIGVLITIGIPIYLLIRMALKKKDTNLSPSNRRSLLILWLIGVALTAVFTVKSVEKTKQIESKILNTLADLDDSGFKEDNIESFVVDENGVVIKGKKGGKAVISSDGKIEITAGDNNSSTNGEIKLESIEIQIEQPEVFNDSIVTESSETFTKSDSIPNK